MSERTETPARTAGQRTPAGDGGTPPVIDAAFARWLADRAGQVLLRVRAELGYADGKALKDQLVLTVKTIDVTTPGTPCDNFDGTQLYTGDLDSTAGKLVGDNTQGSQAGDRSLNAAANEILCFRAALPLATANAFQAATTTATFTFDSEQTANNP